MKGEGNLDRHFFSVRRLVLGISAATFLIVALGELLLARIGTPADFAITAALFVPIYLTAFITKRERGAGAAVALLICLNVAGAVTHAVNLPG